MVTNIIFAISIFWTILFTWVNFSRVICKYGVSALNNIYMAIGWTAIITHIIGIW